jgi:hypothetical protein
MPISKYLKMAQHALQTEQGRAIARSAADGIATAGNRITKNKYASQIEKGRAAIDKHLGGPGDKGRRPSDPPRGPSDPPRR